MKRKRNERIVRYKFIYTFGIIIIYILGRNIPLYGVDHAAYVDAALDTETLLMQTVGGDIYRHSIFALGLSPYLISTMLVQMVAACRKESEKAKISPRKLNRISLGITLVTACCQALWRLNGLIWKKGVEGLVVVQVFAAVQMVTGVMMILWLAERNKKYGIGGQTALIYVNLTESIMLLMDRHHVVDEPMLLVLSLVVIVIVLLMENAEFRIPLQRVSIHNHYSDKNYLAIKLNPIGVMPLMLSTAVFLVPQMIVQVLGYVFPEVQSLAWLKENLTLGRPFGIGIYVAIVYLLTMFLSMIFIHPGDMSEQLLKQGDSILNLHAGEATRRYLWRVVFCLSMFSACVLSLCMAVTLLLQLEGRLESTLVMLPSSIMMLTGVWSNLYREYRAVKTFEEYKPFL